MPRRSGARRFATTSEHPDRATSTRRQTSAGLRRGRRPRPARRVPVHPRRPGRRCTAPGSGRCASTRASRPPRRPTSGSATSWRRARPASRSPSTCRPRWATTPTPRRPRARSGGSASRSRASPTWRRCSTGIPLGEVSTSMTINATAPILLALYVAAAEKQGAPAIGGVAAPPRTTSSRSTSPAGRGSTRRGSRCASSPTCSSSRSRELPQVEHDLDLRLPHARGRGHRRPRSSRSRSPTGSPTSRRPSSRGLAVDDFAPRLSFFFAAWSELFEEVAKFRAARRMWARIMRERFGAPNPKSMMCRFHTQTAGSSLTAQSDRQQRRPDHAPGAGGGARRDPEPAHELAGRGARPADRRRGPPRPPDPADHRPRGRRHRDPDPLGGLVVRRVADRRARGGRAGLPRRDRRDGRHAARRSRAASSSGRSRSRRTGSSARSSARTGSSSGVNRFRDEDGGIRPTIQRIDPEGERRQVESLRRVRAERDAGRLGGGPATASPTRPAATATCMPPIIEAVAAYATVGEISDRLRTVVGRPPRADHRLRCVR